METNTPIELAAPAKSRGQSLIAQLLEGRAAPRYDSPHGAWPEELSPLVAEGRRRHWDQAGARLLLNLLPPLERGLVAHDLLSGCLWSNEEAAFVEELQEAAFQAHPLLPRGRWPVSEAALTMPVETLRNLITMLSPRPEPSSPFALASLMGLIDAAQPSLLDDLLEVLRLTARELHYARLSTLASVILAVLARIGRHEGSILELIELGGSMPGLGGAHAAIGTLIDASPSPQLARLYFDARLAGYTAPEPLREATLSRLREFLFDLTRMDIDSESALRPAPGMEAPTAQRDIDLATLGLAFQELLANRASRPVAQLIDIGARHPEWRFSARVRLGHLIARGGDEASATIMEEEKLFYRMFGPHYPSQQSYIRLLTPGSVTWKRSQLNALEQVQWNLSSRDAWMTLGFHMLSRSGTNEDRARLVDENFARIDQQLTRLSP